MTETKEQAPSLPVPKHIPVEMLGREQRVPVIDEATDEPINQSKNKRKKEINAPMKNSKSNAFFGIVFLIVKASFLIASVALWKMDTVNVIIELPLYQVVGLIILATLVYLELEPYFAIKGKKDKKAGFPHTNRRPSDFIETAI